MQSSLRSTSNEGKLVAESLHSVFFLQRRNLFTLFQGNDTSFWRVRNECSLNSRVPSGQDLQGMMTMQLWSWSTYYMADRWITAPQLSQETELSLAQFTRFCARILKWVICAKFVPRISIEGWQDTEGCDKSTLVGQCWTRPWHHWWWVIGLCVQPRDQEGQYPMNTQKYGCQTQIITTGSLWWFEEPEHTATDKESTQIICTWKPVSQLHTKSKPKSLLNTQHFPKISNLHLNFDPTWKTLTNFFQNETIERHLSDTQPVTRRLHLKSVQFKPSMLRAMLSWPGQLTMLICTCKCAQVCSCNIFWKSMAGPTTYLHKLSFDKEMGSGHP